jgi:hypothetical protein
MKQIDARLLAKRKAKEEVLDKWLPLFSQHYDLTNMIIWNKGGGRTW